MKKLIIFIFLLINVYANEFEIKSINTNSAVIECDNLSIGQSGVVVRNLGEFNSIIKNATLTKIEANECIVNLSEFNSLTQIALPSLKESPKVGDKVIFNSFYNKGLVISPNAKTYYKVVDKYIGKTWIHSDIFATYLEGIKNPSPTKENFNEFCNAYSIGLVYFILDKEYIVDCNSFKVIDTKEINIENSKNSKDEIKPFYSRLGELEASFFSFKNEMKDYKEYYKNLLK